MKKRSANTSNSDQDRFPTAPRLLKSISQVESASFETIVVSELPVDKPDVSENSVKAETLSDNLGKDESPPVVPVSATENSEVDSVSDQFPVNLPTVLRLAGAENWDIQLATERVREAQARLNAAKVLWLPSLTAGIGYTKHDGKIQATRGQVIDVSRNSLFVGGGAGLGSSPLAGGAGGPARLVVDLSLADAIFEPLVARQRVSAAEARESAMYNDTLLSTAVAYYELVRAQGRLANSQQNLNDAEELLKLTTAFVMAGKGPQADTARAQTELGTRQQQLVDADLSIQVESAELLRILGLDQGISLFALEENPMPVELVHEAIPVEQLVAQGILARPEIVAANATMEANRKQARQERLRPFIPNLFVGASAGGFGGGKNDTLNQLDGRSDFDVIAVWEAKNLGFGNRAARQERSSQFRRALLNQYRVRDQVAADITKAFHQVRANRTKIAMAESNLKEAGDSYRQNLARIRGLEGLPLEALQAAKAVASARNDYLDVIVDYNQAQVRLHRAVGQSVQ